MRPLAGELLLAAWEEGAPGHDLGRALTMLATALPGTDREQLGALPIAERNLLLRLHELSFGPWLSVFGICAGWCSSHELLDLDMARFLWMEVRAAARRLLGEIHQLASAYGWSERAIAGMSPGRRAAYLEMLSA